MDAARNPENTSFFWGAANALSGTDSVRRGDGATPIPFVPPEFSMIVIGIVGSPAGGKSTVASHLQGLGATWVNADRIAHETLRWPAVRATLLQHFGLEIADNRGEIDRGKLAGRVFGDDDAQRAALTYLESVVHPATRRVITQQLKEASGRGAVASILDVPLLFESHWDRCCDEVWCVDASVESRLARAADRGWSADELRRRESRQLNIREKRRRSTSLLRNDGSLQELTETIEQRWSFLIERCAAHPSPDHCFQDL